MALSIRELARRGEFDCDLNSLGRVRCINLRTSHLSEANEKLAATDVQSLDVVRWLLGEMARRPVEGTADDHDPANNPRFTAEELTAVTDAELEEFAEKLVSKNKYLLLKTHEGSDIAKLVDESACDFLARAFRHYAAEQKAQWRRMIESVSKPVFAETTLDSIRKNFGLSDQLQNTIAKYTDSLKADRLNITEPKMDVFAHRMPELHIPKNPIYETNKTLENVVKQIEDLRPMAAQAAQLISSMNDTALSMQVNYIKNAEETGRQTKIAMRIAAAGLVLTVIGLAISSYFSYQSSIDSNESSQKSDAQFKAFQIEIRDLAAAQHEERAALLKAITDGQRAFPGTVKK